MNTLDSVSGYYKLGNTVIQNKLQALTDPALNGRHLEYVFHDDVYSKLNWAVEPTETLEQLYARRAWEIREKYDHLIIHFSGGSDSANIVETFLKNNIPFEELFSRSTVAQADLNPNNTSADNCDAELQLNAVPIVEHIQRMHPNIKIRHTIGDHKNNVYNYFTNNPDWFDVTKYNIGTTFLPNDVNRADHDVYFPQFNKLAETGKSVAHVIGVEKPMMYFDNGNYFARFLDKQVKFQLSSRRTSIDTPINLVPFYWAKSTGPMIIKQCHAIKNYWKYKNLNPGMIANRSKSAQDLFASIIYNRTLPMFWQNDKVHDGFMQGHRFFTEDTQTLAYKNWINGVVQLDRMIPAMYKTGSILRDLHGTWSKSYCIGN